MLGTPLWSTSPEEEKPHWETQTQHPEASHHTYLQGLQTLHPSHPPCQHPTVQGPLPTVSALAGRAQHRPHQPDSLLHHQHQLGRALEGSEALHKARVMQRVHELHLGPRRLLLFSCPRPEVFPSPDFAGGSLPQPIHRPELSPGAERGMEEPWPPPCIPPRAAPGQPRTGPKRGDAGPPLTLPASPAACTRLKPPPGC